MLFSDIAYVALPPRSPAAELRPSRGSSAVRPRTGGALPSQPESPWSRQFSAGTQISSGLALALDRVLAEGEARLEVLLVSDLDDSASDTGALAAVVLEYRRAGVPLRVVALDPEPMDRRTFDALIAQPGAVTVAPDPAQTAVPESRVRDRRLIAAALLTGVLLAGLLVATSRLHWRART